MYPGLCKTIIYAFKNTLLLALVSWPLGFIQIWISWYPGHRHRLSSKVPPGELQGNAHWSADQQRLQSRRCRKISPTYDHQGRKRSVRI